MQFLLDIFQDNISVSVLSVDTLNTKAMFEASP